MQYFADQVTERTNGQVTFRIYWAEALGGAKELLPLVSSRGADIVYVTTAYYPAEFKFSRVTSVQMVAQHCEATARALEKLYVEFPEILGEFRAHNCEPLLNLPVEVTMIGSNKRIESLADLKGLRIRSSGLAVPLLGAWGAVPVALPSPEIYGGMERGILDGYTNQPIDSAVAYSLQEVTEYFVDVGIGIYTVATVAINMDTLEALPADVRKVVEEAVPAAEAFYLESYADLNRQTIAEALEAGVEIYRLSPEVRQQLQQLGLPAVKKYWVDTVVSQGADEAMALELVNRYEVLCNYLNRRAIFKISQTKGLRDPEVGIPLNPSALLRRLGMGLECRVGSVRGGILPKGAFYDGGERQYQSNQ